MSQPTGSGQISTDSRLRRHLWLMRVSFAGRMLASRHFTVPAISKDPAHQLQRAYQLLITTIRVQIEGDADFMHAHPSSANT